MNFRKFFSYLNEAKSEEPDLSKFKPIDKPKGDWLKTVNGYHIYKRSPYYSAYTVYEEQKSSSLFKYNKDLKTLVKDLKAANPAPKKRFVPNENDDWRQDMQNKIRSGEVRRWVRGA